VTAGTSADDAPPWSRITEGAAATARMADDRSQPREERTPDAPASAVTGRGGGKISLSRSPFPEPFWWQIWWQNTNAASSGGVNH
jgi:hypothetical protein